MPDPGVTSPSVSDRPSPLPASVRLAWWGTAWLRGYVVADHLIDAVLDQDAVSYTHLTLPTNREV